MIARTKVNYNLVDLLRAVVVSEQKLDARNRVKQLLLDHLSLPNAHCILTASGRSALQILLKTSGRKYAVAPAYTCKAVGEAIKFSDQQAVWVGTEAAGYNMDVDLLEPALAQLPIGSAVVIATHQYGIPCDIERTIEIARKYQAIVLEDCAGSLGSRVNGKPVGSFGDACVFSFDSTKLIHTPLKAGAAVVHDQTWATAAEQFHASISSPHSLAEKYKLLVKALILLVIENPLVYRVFHYLLFGRTGRFMLDSPKLPDKPGESFTKRCSEWQASIVARQLARLADYVASRQHEYAEFQELFAGSNNLALPPVDTKREWSCVRFPLLVEGDKIAFYHACNRQGVDLAFSFTYLTEPGCEARADDIARRVINIPYYAKLSSAERKRVAEVCRSIADQGAIRENARSRRDDSQPPETQRALFKG